ncbi:PREDICTED: patatin-like phospholipase domain-containing protein 7 [Apaloderma vittatum]|uniref:patatin-like phospholipase domain-containing protein 7 n=1 Tax=Apaloderma vittatum TaxID=57397 RepID=UPI000521B739|nr:PREDICTED: patatin-like phospholipase domain-containing protein 7 [Apaloderma vittatum]
MLKDRQETCKSKTDNVTCPTTSFTDLAEIVSRIEPVKAPVADDESDYQTEYEEEILDSQKDDYIDFISNQAEEDSDSDEDMQIRKRRNVPGVESQASSTGEPG